MRYPDARLAISILCNRDDLDPAQVARSIADLLLEETFPDAAPAQAPQAEPAIALPIERLQANVGLYLDASDDSLARVFVRDGKLMLSAPDGAEYALTPIAPNRFVIAGTSARAEFKHGTDGKAQEVHVTGAGPTPTVARKVAPFAPSRAALRDYEGTYTSDEVDGTYSIVARDSSLILRVPTRTDIEMPSAFADAFSNRMLGMAKFHRDARGRITSFTATAAGIRGLRFNRISAATACRCAPTN